MAMFNSYVSLPEGTCCWVGEEFWPATSPAGSINREKSWAWLRVRLRLDPAVFGCPYYIYHSNFRIGPAITSSKTADNRYMYMIMIIDNIYDIIAIIFIRSFGGSLMLFDVTCSRLGDGSLSRPAGDGLFQTVVWCALEVPVLRDGQIPKMCTICKSTVCGIWVNIEYIYIYIWYIYMYVYSFFYIYTYSSYVLVNAYIHTSIHPYIHTSIHLSICS